MAIIGRKNETDLLDVCLASGRPEFMVVYGRRRVGKTYLIRQYFNQSFSFYATGVANLNTRGQLRAFNESLIDYGCEDRTIPKDWFEAFSRLKRLLQRDDVHRDPVSGRVVVFLDEVPWMDTARSDFRSALEFFWNSYASARDDILFIACGSATSWIIDNFLSSTGGFYNRVTRQLHLAPFSLGECEELLQANGLRLSKHQVIECYMIFGGIPYYLNCLDRRMSLAQNVDALCFSENGQLRHEYDHLYASLFKNPGKHIAVIKALAKNKSGVLRAELAKISEIGDGAPLSKTLSELEQCGFIRKYKNYTKNKSGFYYQLTDPFTLFHLDFIEPGNVQSWLGFMNHPGYNAWSGFSFELVCLNHIRQIKNALGISGVSSSEYSWRSRNTVPGAQIDLLIDRADEVVNICEMKFSKEPFTIDASYEKQLNHKMDAFRSETKSDKTLFLTLITSKGIIRNEHSEIVAAELNEDVLFGTP